MSDSVPDSESESESKVASGDYNHKKLASMLKLCADLAELLSENPFAYRNVLRAVENGAFNGQALAQVPRLSKTLLADIEAWHAGAEFAPLQQFSAQVPAGVLSLFQVRGLGAKKIRMLWDHSIDNLEALITACREGHLSKIKGFGEKTQQNILEAALFVQQQQGLMHISSADQWVAQALTLYPEAIVLGASQRRLETVDTIWLGFSHLPSEPLAQPYQAVLYRGGISELEHAHPAFWQMIQQRAEQHQLDLSQASGTASSILRALGLPPLPPEHWEAEHIPYLQQLPATELLVQTSDILGMLHVHSLDSDGVPTVAQLAHTVAAMGPQHYLGMGDHSQLAVYANGLSPQRLRAQMQTIDALRGEGLRILKGAEVDILADGQLDYPDDLLSELDYVVASVHSAFTLSESEQTQRLIRAVSHPLVTILGHPSGRLLLRRPAYACNLEAVLEAASVHQTAIEINANPYRLDLDWRIALRWRDKLRFAINTDAHVLTGLQDVRYGVAVARKAGLTPAHILNSRPYEDWLKT